MADSVRFFQNAQSGAVVTLRDQLAGVPSARYSGKEPQVLLVGRLSWKSKDNDSVVLSEGSTAEAIVASTAIPGAFSPIRYKDYYLADGAISSNTPIQVAVKKGARRLIILPTGHACANQAPPVGAVANALHALTLLIARQLVNELEALAPDIEYFVVPPLCPLVGSPYDFSRTADHIDRAILSTDAWLAQHGLQQGKIPHEMRLHSH